MAGPLLTTAELQVWTRTDIAPDDEFALAVIDGISLLVSETAGHPEWDSSTVPPRAKLIAVLAAKRNYLNPDAIVSSNVGPLGERTIEDFARTMELTDAETVALQAMTGTSDTPDYSPDLWLLPMESRPLETAFYLVDDPKGTPIGPYATSDEVSWAFTPINEAP